MTDPDIKKSQMERGDIKNTRFSLELKPSNKNCIKLLRIIIELELDLYWEGLNSQEKQHAFTTNIAPNFPKLS